MFTTIRFRLTVWYALLLLLILLVLGLSFSWFLQRELYRDVDARLARTAQEIARQSQVVADPMTGDLSTIVPQALFRSPSQYIQAVQPDGQIGVSSQNLYGKKLPVAQLEPGERTPAYKTIELDGVRIRTLTLPIYLQSNNQALGTINVGESLSQVDRTLSSVRRLLLAGGAGGIALAALAGFLLAGRALRPVDRITATAAAIAAGTRPQRLQTERLTVSKHADELARLSATFNAMLDRLAETFATQRRFVSDASHELRTPLTALRGNIDVLSRQAEAGALTPEDVTATLDDLRRESRRMSRLVEDLLVLARTEELPTASLEPVRLDLIAHDAYRSALSLATGQSITIDASAPVWVSGDDGRLTQLAVILLDNAIRHTQPGGEVAIAVHAKGNSAALIVRDTGEGIAPEHLPRLFDRFYRADASRVRHTGGTGLGLAIALAVVQLHGGTIEVASTIGTGSTFTVTLPTIPPPPDAD